MFLFGMISKPINFLYVFRFFVVQSGYLCLVTPVTKAKYIFTIFPHDNTFTFNTTSLQGVALHATKSYYSYYVRYTANKYHCGAIENICIVF